MSSMLADTYAALKKAGASDEAARWRPKRSRRSRTGWRPWASDLKLVKSMVGTNENYVQPLLPKGTVLMFHSHYDNTVNNPINPDPEQWVLSGARGVDEMSHAWVGMTYLEEEDFAHLAAEREAAAASDIGR